MGTLKKINDTETVPLGPHLIVLEIVPFFVKKGTVFQNGPQGHCFSTLFSLSAG